MNTAVLVIDVQEALVAGAYRREALISNINTLIRASRAADVPVVFIQHNHATYDAMKPGTPGWAIHAGLDRQADDVVVGKEASDAFCGTTLESRLREMGITQVIVTGMQTEYCVDTTCRAALSLDFDVILAADAHTTGDSRLSAADVIAHHNALLANVVHPRRRIRVLPVADISGYSEGHPIETEREEGES